VTALLEYLDLAFLQVVGIHTISHWFELDSLTPLEYASMLSNPARHQFSDDCVSGLCGTDASNLDRVIITRCWFFLLYLHSGWLEFFQGV